MENFKSSFEVNGLNHFYRHIKPIKFESFLSRATIDLHHSQIPHSHSHSNCNVVKMQRDIICFHYTLVYTYYIRWYSIVLCVILSHKVINLTRIIRTTTNY